MERLAPAKINLALHVTGQRDDGYHLIDSLVTFAEIGDRLSFEPARSVSLMETGPFGEHLMAGGPNLVLRAWEALERHFSRLGQAVPHAAITLEKNLPVASGLGGGSADAAAALLGLNAMAEHPLDKAALHEIALSLGADVPMCLESIAARVTGIGEIIGPVTLPSFSVVLANSGAHLSTPVVFSNLEEKQNSPLDSLPGDADADGWITWLRKQRNDLQKPAARITSEIEPCIATLEETGGCRLARMSGSGETCFGIFQSPGDADMAAEKIRSLYPDWWVVSTRTNP